MDAQNRASKDLSISFNDTSMSNVPREE